MMMVKTAGVRKKIVYRVSRFILFAYPIYTLLYFYNDQSSDLFLRANLPLPLALKTFDLFLKMVQIGAPAFFLSAIIQIFFFKRTIWKIIVPIFAFSFCAFSGLIFIDGTSEYILTSTKFSGDRYFYTDYPQVDFFDYRFSYAKLYKCNLENRDCVVINESWERHIYINTKLLANEERGELYLFSANRFTFFNDSQVLGEGASIISGFSAPAIYLVELFSEPVYWLYECDEAQTACSRLPFTYQGDLELIYGASKGNPETKDFSIYGRDDEVEDRYLVYSYVNGVPRCHIEGCTLGDE